jgi:putative ABC transport system permease protein
MRDMRKVVVIGKDVYNELFKGKPALGEYIRVSTVPFQVVGVFESKQERENRKVYMPILTSQMVFNKVNHIEDVAMLFDASANVEQSKDVEQNIKNQMAKRHHYAVDDGRALYTYNVFNEFNQMQSLFASIRLFVWIIGIGTIIAGIVGVSNIMLIVVRERTREIGIRKAIGASPASIVSQVIAEAVLITSIAGYVGLVLGVLLLEGLKPVFSKSQGMFQNPEVNFTVAISATILLIISGTLAGLIPAVRAASVKPIEALKEE